MASIRPVRGEIIRPLLDTGREEIEDWLKKNGISWRTDASNETDAYTRNRIRRQVLPYVEREICAEAGVHLAQAAQLLMQTSDFVDRKARARLAECLAFEEERAAGLDVKAFLESEELLQGQMLKLLLERLSGGGRISDSGMCRTCGRFSCARADEAFPFRAAWRPGGISDRSSCKRRRTGSERMSSQGSRPKPQVPLRPCPETGTFWKRSGKTGLLRCGSGIRNAGDHPPAMGKNAGN